MILNKIRKVCGVGLVCLLPFLVSSDYSLRKVSEKEIKYRGEKYYATKVSDLDKKATGWFITDDEGRVIGDESIEEKLYSHLAFTAEMEDLTNKENNGKTYNNIYDISSERINNLDDLLKYKFLLYDAPNFIVEKGSYVEGILLGAIYSGGANLSNAAQKEIISSTVKNYGKDLLQDYYDQIDVDELKEELIKGKPVEEYLAEKFEDNINFNLLRARHELKTAENLAKNKNRTKKENELMWGNFSNGNARFYAYTNLTKKLVEGNTWVNIGKKIAKNLAHGVTGADVLSIIIEDEGFQEAFDSVGEDMEKITDDLSSFEGYWDVGDKGSSTSEFLDLIEDREYKEEVKRFVGKEKPKSIKKPKIKKEISKQKKEILKPIENSKLREEKKTCMSEKELRKSYGYKNVPTGCYILDINKDGINEVVEFEFNEESRLYEAYNVKVNDYETISIDSLRFFWVQKQNTNQSFCYPVLKNVIVNEEVSDEYILLNVDKYIEECVYGWNGKKLYLLNVPLNENCMVKEEKQIEKKKNVHFQVNVERKDKYKMSIRDCPEIRLHVDSMIDESGEYVNFTMFSGRSGTSSEYLCRSDKPLIQMGFDGCVKSEENLNDTIITLKGLGDLCYFSSGRDEPYYYEILGLDKTIPRMNTFYPDFVKEIKKVAKEQGLEWKER